MKLVASAGTFPERCAGLAMTGLKLLLDFAANVAISRRKQCGGPVGNELGRAILF
jgi:hypothetical protein